MSFLRSRRARIWAVVAIVVALIATFPLSIAFSLLGLKDMGVTARSLRGPVWWGGAEELTIGSARLGTLNVFFDPFHLLIAQAQVELIRVNGRPDDLLGAVVVGPGVRGVERVTGVVPLGSTLGSLPITRAQFDKFSVRFSGGRCVEAEGRVRATVAPTLGGLDLANGLSGDARCDGEALLIPLASQSGQERIDLRIRGGGTYDAFMRIRTNDPVLTGALATSGFQAVNGEQVLRISGTFVSALPILLIGAGIGAIIGSFLATIVSRWPRDQSVVTGRSRCDGCGRTLNALDLIPLVGWLVARGKCRRCGARIDWVHPFIELGCLLIGGFCAWAFPPVIAGLFAVGGWLLLTLAVLDARHLWLPDALTLPLAALGLTLGGWFLPASFWDRVIGAMAGALFLALLAFAYRTLRGREGLGLGDAKLLGAIGAWMGWQALPFVLLVASATALLWALGMRVAGKSVDTQTQIPLGTFLCLAVVPTWVVLTAIFA